MENFFSCAVKPLKLLVQVMSNSIKNTSFKLIIFSTGNAKRNLKKRYELAMFHLLLRDGTTRKLLAVNCRL